MINKYFLEKEIKSNWEPENKLSFIYDFKDCLFKQNDNDALFPNLKKWIRYSAVDYGDADQVLKIPENEETLKKIGWNSIKYIDCIFSMRTFLNAFFRMYFDSKIPYGGELLDNFEEYFSEKALDNFSNREKIDTNTINSLFEAIDTFAIYTHTLGNYMPCVDSYYNGIKGNIENFQDRIELLYQDLCTSASTILEESIRSKWKKWFDDNSKLLFLDQILECQKLLEFKCSSRKQGKYTIFFMSSEQDLKNFTDRLSTINDLIIQRNKEIYKKINSLK